MILQQVFLKWKQLQHESHIFRKRVLPPHITDLLDNICNSCLLSNDFVIMISLLQRDQQE